MAEQKNAPEHVYRFREIDGELVEQKEAPSAGTTRGENTSVLSEESDMNTTTVTPTTDTRDSLEPEIPDGMIVPPAWATYSEECGVEVQTEFPMIAHYQDLSGGETMTATIQQIAKYDTENKRVLWDAPQLIVWADADTQIVLEHPGKAHQLRNLLNEGAHVLEQILEVKP